MPWVEYVAEPDIHIVVLPDVHELLGYGVCQGHIVGLLNTFLQVATNGIDVANRRMQLSFKLRFYVPSIAWSFESTLGRQWSKWKLTESQHRQ